MKIKCPGCATLLQIPDSAAGKVVKCKCGKQLRAPLPKGTAKPAPKTQPGAGSTGAAGPPGAGPPGAAAPGAVPPGAAAPVPYSPFPAPEPKGSGGIFDELTDTDLSGIKAVKVPGQAQKITPTATGQKALQEAAQDFRKEKADKHTAHLEGAKKEIYTSIGIYALLGLIQIGIGIFLLTQAEEEAKYLALQEGNDLKVNLIFGMIRAVLTIKICLGICFFIAASTFMLLPMTSAIAAIITFLLGEIVSLVINPFLIISVRGWIIRVITFGALLQAINNASYYRFVRGGGRDKDAASKAAAKKSAANKFDKKSTSAAIGALAAVIATFGIGGVFIYQGFNRKIGPAAQTAEEKRRGVPKGFELYETQGVSVFMPIGRPIDPAGGPMEYRAISTITEGTVFMMGVADVGGEKLTGDALKNQIERLTQGTYRAGMATERNGYRGEKGSITKSVRFAPGEGTRAPQLNVEVFQDDGRIIMIGVAQETSSSENIIVGQSAEPEIEQIFNDSLEIGPKPAVGGLLW